MAQIGTFTRDENGNFAGTIRTLALSVKATIKPCDRDNDKASDYRVSAKRPGSSQNPACGSAASPALPFVSSNKQFQASTHSGRKDGGNTLCAVEVGTIGDGFTPAFSQVSINCEERSVVARISILSNRRCDCSERIADG
ncbi:hypothetical protein GGE43_003916 [Agrobacterium tumefaciens]|jgi:hypothetical protein|uniref:DUF736 domain-containing protein n=1 Tax=Agrobacterium radiobacter TaxID=362 RepID=A0ABR6JBY7_AGRRD|nr:MULTISPECIES: DUF736 family protein [Agrobacterium tumefaciens complex]MCP2137935.1 hypothetical protein [Rhizobium sp. SLBN-94]MBB4320632.1 hypothetical protein [Agrobacterium radiobacter]MBB4337296.1 hypothetical protein [Agrobacterium radiobacter]MBB4492455.1 hypothetical protein [Agrobacterium radiobacter]MBB4497354.1 hypothetical protein [Agrobacterium radiobacter]